MKLSDIINIANERNECVLAFTPDMIVGNAKRDTWIRIDPEHKSMKEVDRKAERTYLASYNALERDDWGISTQIPHQPT